VNSQSKQHHGKTFGEQDAKSLRKKKKIRRQGTTETTKVYMGLMILILKVDHCDQDFFFSLGCMLNWSML
jgi:hypothetical protein